MVKRIIIIVAVVLFVAGGGFVFVTQYNKAGKLQKEQSSLQQQVSGLTKQYVSVKAASDIKTDTWKQYCDPLHNHCFKYPADWQLEESGADPADRVGATLTNPAKTLYVNYANPLVKDGGVQSAHIVSVADMKLGNDNVKMFGVYPVSSGIYQPEYALQGVDKYTKDLLKNSTAGKVGLYIINPRFDVGQDTGIMMRAWYAGTDLTSQAQAEAWFNSIEGKTAKAIVSSYTVK